MSAEEPEEPEDAEPAEESVTAEEPDPLADSDLTHLLRLALQTVRAETMTELAAAGYEQLGPLHDLAFSVLQTRGGCTSDELGEEIGVATPEAVKLAKELEKRGYLRRIPGPRGPRHPHYVITSKAQQHLRAAGYVQARQEARLAEWLGGNGLTELRTRLAQLVRSQAGSEVPPLRPIW
ncbi:MarR family winged helix-turn-helix transcriptional regulator [Kineosporia sp. NBRC 101677]|uniref:MarR family winged helix-turn-helix transcriptional regulator n=1 Tax=Kineosporia sp. NBRC 101677 TaxID=3032197 RepID=UPI002553CF33|nr:MarR family winged helix-turn-helix transcriptional regulator [Kineosporia sp. NBRC 101677]